VKDRETVKGDISKQVLYKTALRNNFNFHTYRVDFVPNEFNDYFAAIPENI
jgi:hypothetical protein